MDAFEKLFNEAWNDSVTLGVLARSFYKRHFEKRGVALTQAQLDSIEAFFENPTNTETEYEIDFNEDQLLHPYAQTVAETNILEGEAEDMDDFESEVQAKMHDSIKDFVVTEANHLLGDFRENISAMLAEDRRDQIAFESRLQRKWSKAFDLMELLHLLTIEAGNTFNQAFATKAQEENDSVFIVLRALHARACQVYGEVLTLLRAGYADGAHARWRTLHEIAVVAFSIKQFGNETAERYLQHEKVESYKAAKQHRDYEHRINEAAISDAQMQRVTDAHDAVIHQYGKEFATDYGWAAHILNDRKPTFDRIEKAVELDHWRPYYKLASHNVHAQPKGISFKLGLYKNQSGLLLAGPSDTGLTDAGHGAALSLGLINIALLNTRTTIDILITHHILNSLIQEIGDVMVRIDNRRPSLIRHGRKPRKKKWRARGNGERSFFLVLHAVAKALHSRRAGPG